MNGPMRKAVVAVACAVCWPALCWAQGVEPNEPAPEATAYIIPCKGLIDDGLKESIERRTKMALDAGAKYVIYEISTYGGLLESGDSIAKYFLDTASQATTVAFVTTEAISAGAMISVSCSEIVMRSIATIGACAPVMMGGKLEGVEREKTESFVRGIFDRAAEANRYPKPLLRAMVTVRVEVYRVRNKETGEYEFFEGDELPKDPNFYDLDNKELIDSDEELLTLTAAKAVEYGLAGAVVEDREGMLDFLAARDQVAISRPAVVLETNWSEKMVRWLNHPAVMSVLIMVALLGIYIELSTPGVGLPGLVAVISLSVIIGSKYLVGMANWVEIALFFVGMLLLLLEFLVIPGFGIAGVLGILCMVGGLFGMLMRNPPERLPWPQTQFDWQLLVYDALGMALGFLGFAVLAVIFAKYLPRIQFLSGLILAPAAAKTGEEFEVSLSGPPEGRGKGVAVGDIGEVVSTLRPTGKVRFGDTIVDCLTEGEFINKGVKVRIAELRGNRVCVNKLEGQG